MQYNTVRVICLVALGLGVTSVDACGGPGPNRCDYFNCKYPRCDDFYNATCKTDDEPCPGYEKRCRCPTSAEKCCHVEECIIEDFMSKPTMMQSGYLEVSGLPEGVEVASLGAHESGVALTADANGRLPPQWRLYLGIPFKLRTVTFMTSPAQVTSFTLTLKGPYQPNAGEVMQVNGDSISFRPDEIADEIIIDDIEIGGHDRVTFMRAEIMGCLDPACEEAGGVCLEQLPSNTGMCPLGKEAVGQFHDGPGFGCKGKRESIKCCRPSRQIS